MWNTSKDDEKSKIVVVKNLTSFSVFLFFFFNSLSFSFQVFLFFFFNGLEFCWCDFCFSLIIYFWFWRATLVMLRWFKKSWLSKNQFFYITLNLPKTCWVFLWPLLVSSIKSVSFTLVGSFFNFILSFKFQILLIWSWRLNNHC